MLNTITSLDLRNVVGGGQAASDTYTPIPGDGAVHIDYSKPVSTTCIPYDNPITHYTQVQCTTYQKYEDSTLFKPQQKR
jgi:hypothetical protein